MPNKQKKKGTWKKRGIIISAFALILIAGELLSSLNIPILIIGLIVFIGGAILAAHDYLEYQKMLIAEKKKVKAEKKALLERKEQLRKEIEESEARRAALVQQSKEIFDKLLQSIPRREFVVSEKVNRNKEIDYPDISFKNITRKTNISKLFPLVVIDIETTGLEATADIIEVAAIKFNEGFTAESCISMLCKPRKPIPAEATEVNGITDDMVKDCPSFSQIAASVTEYIKGCSLVGHNLDFDLKRLFISGVTLSENVSYFDTLKLARYVLKAENRKKYNYKSEQYEDVEDWDVTDYKLDTLCEHYGIYRNDNHRALSDCLATEKLFESLIDEKTAIEV